MNAIRSFGRRQAFQALGDPTPPPVVAAKATPTWWESLDGAERIAILFSAGTAVATLVGGIVGARVAPQRPVLGTIAGGAVGAVAGFFGTRAAVLASGAVGK